MIVSAPGSIMITGEHAVVEGHPSIVAAINQRVTVTIGANTSGKIAVTSEIAEPQESPLDALDTSGPYRFVHAAIRHAGVPISGLDIDITSQIDPKLGLGSSAAVTIATLAALKGHAKDEVHTAALRVIREIQGRGSGADLAASLRGGALAYQLGETPILDPLPMPPDLGLYYVGYKTPTAQVLQKVAEMRRREPGRIGKLIDEMGQTAQATIAEIKSQGWSDIGKLLQSYQRLMCDLGVSDAALDLAVNQAQDTPSIIGAKISGSGLGDCVVAIGAVPGGFEPVTIAPQGVVFHDNGS